MRQKLLSENPFADVRGGSQENKSREFFITFEMAEKVLDACPDHEWRLIFALSRYGGLRCPSEHMELTWSDVDWANERLTIRSPKTEHHHGRESRQVPLFPELRVYLEAMYDRAKPGTVHIITRYRSKNANLRTQLERIIKRAGLKPWPKLFQNLRSTRQTELLERFPIHVVCQWIGNSALVAQRHYLQVTDAHFAEAARRPVCSGAKSGAQAAQNPAQQPAARSRTELQSDLPGSSQVQETQPLCDAVPKETAACEDMLPGGVFDQGGPERSRTSTSVMDTRT